MEKFKKPLSEAAPAKNGSKPALASDPGQSEAKTADFQVVFDAECHELNIRRKHYLRLEDIIRENIDPQKKGEKYTRTVANNIVGLALSGGGIRSAAFCMGVLQGLNKAKLIPYIDYLSTVSGGGYIGTAMTVAMSAQEEPSSDEKIKEPQRTDQVTFPAFPFDREYQTDGETGHTKHIRDHSRYLLPRGASSLPSVIGAYVRGLAASIIAILPFIVTASLVMLAAFDSAPALCSRSDILEQASQLIGQTSFPVTLSATAVATLLFFAYAVMNSISYTVRPNLVNAAGWLVIAILFLLIIELQRLFLIERFNCVEACKNFPGTRLSIVNFVVQPFLLVCVALPFIIPWLRVLARKAAVGSDEKFYQQAIKLLSQLSLYLVACFIPLLVWLAWFYLTYWGIAYTSSATAEMSDTPKALIALFGWAGKHIAPAGMSPAFVTYLVLLALLLCMWRLLDANANSLLAFYKHRLTEAFLFVKSGGGATDCLRLSKLTSLAPYHIINATLNIPGSKEANKRGRNGDFFMFTKKFIGSEIADYVGTAALEDRWDVDVGHAMAISGAAAAPNMGVASLRPLAFTLALLNIRLGYWFPNPKIEKTGLSRKSYPSALYFLREAFFATDHEDDFVFLSDGGHIDNLGIYELLRRRAAVIIAVDAEADSEMNFGALVQAMRFARIDQRIKIELPWAAIKRQSLLVNRQLSRNEPRTLACGPHAALGIIEYPASANSPVEYGVLLYIKASLSGDESDYIMDYKRRNSAFPHETTLDQFFTEEQFECYRALGFHIADGLFHERDHCVYPRQTNIDEMRALQQAMKMLNNSRFVRYEPAMQS